MALSYFYSGLTTEDINIYKIRINKIFSELKLLIDERNVKETDLKLLSDVIIKVGRGIVCDYMIYIYDNKIKNYINEKVTNTEDLIDIQLDTYKDEKNLPESLSFRSKSDRIRCYFGMMKKFSNIYIENESELCTWFKNNVTLFPILEFKRITEGINGKADFEWILDKGRFAESDGNKFNIIDEIIANIKYVNESIKYPNKNIRIRDLLSINVEFEYKSGNFISHKHGYTHLYETDMVICCIKNTELAVPILELGNKLP